MTDLDMSVIQKVLKAWREAPSPLRTIYMSKAVYERLIEEYPVVDGKIQALSSVSIVISGAMPDGYALGYKADGSVVMIELTNHEQVTEVHSEPTV
jgi:hypothetical protein